MTVESTKRTVVHLPKSSKSNTMTPTSPCSSSHSICSAVSNPNQYHNSAGTNAESHQMQHQYYHRQHQHQHQHQHHQQQQQNRSCDITIYGGQFLVSDTLYFEVPQSINDNDIVTLLSSCRPILIQRIKCHNQIATGWIRFVNKEQADRAYTLFEGLVLKNSHRLQLYITPDGAKDQVPSSPIFQVTNLPLYMTNDGLYNLFRPFGPIRLCKVIVEKDTSFNGMALLQYFYQQDADNAQMAMNNKRLEGKLISIFALVSNKPSRNSEIFGTRQQQSQTNKADQASVIDYTNLYIKNLDLSAKSADLYNAFRDFGRIISARVMKNPRTKQSRGYGFVSFCQPEEARAALEQFNGKYILSKPVIIAYHEPKRVAATNTTTSPNLNTTPISMTTSGSAARSIPASPHALGVPQKHRQQYYSHSQEQQHQRPTISPLEDNFVINSNNHHHLQQRHDHCRHDTPTARSSSSLSSSPSSAFIKNVSLHQQYSDPSQSQRSHIRAAILEVIEKDKDLDKLDHWVDAIMSLRSTSRALCLFNPTYLMAKLEETRPITVTSQRRTPSPCFDQYQQQRLMSGSPNRQQKHHQHQPQQQQQQQQNSGPQQYYHQHHHATYISSTPKTPNLIQPDDHHSHASSSTTGSSGAMTATTSTTDIAQMHDIEKQEQHHSIARFVESIKGLSLLQQKQQLGDHLFPHVKATGVKQASKVTIHLLDTQPLDQLAYSMHSMELLKPLVEKASLTLTRQQDFIKAVMQK